MPARCITLLFAAVVVSMAAAPAGADDVRCDGRGAPEPQIASCTRDIEGGFDDPFYAYYNRGVAYSKLGQFGKAAEDFAYIVDRVPNDQEARHFLALALADNGDTARAIEECNRLIAEAPEAGKHHAYACRAYARLKEGAYAEAIADAEKALKLYSGSERARKTLEEAKAMLAGGGGAGGWESASGGGPECAKTPDETLADFSAEFDGLVKSHPNRESSDGGGTREHYQYAWFLGEEGLRLLEPYRPCLGPHYDPNHTQLEAMSRKGKEGCIKTATDPASCTPTDPF